MNFDGYLDMHNWYVAVQDANADRAHAREMRSILYGPPHPENPTAYLFAAIHPAGTPLELDRTETPRFEDTQRAWDLPGAPLVKDAPRAS